MEHEIGVGKDGLLIFGMEVATLISYMLFNTDKGDAELGDKVTLGFYSFIGDEEGYGAIANDGKMCCIITHNGGGSCIIIIGVCD